LLHCCIRRLEEPVDLPGAALRVRHKHQGSDEENRRLFHDHALSLEPETKMGTGTASCRASPLFVSGFNFAGFTCAPAYVVCSNFDEISYRYDSAFANESASKTGAIQVLRAGSPATSRTV
jgi:hypothetical protein